MFQDRKKYERSDEYRRRAEEWKKLRSDYNGSDYDNTDWDIPLEEDTSSRILVYGLESLPDKFHSDGNASPTIPVTDSNGTSEEYGSDDTTEPVSDSDNPIDGSDSEDADPTTTFVTDCDNAVEESESEDDSLLVSQVRKGRVLKKKYGIAEPYNYIVIIQKSSIV